MLLNGQHILLTLTEAWFYGHFCTVVGEDKTTASEVFTICGQIEKRRVMERFVSYLKLQFQIIIFLY